MEPKVFDNYQCQEKGLHLVSVNEVSPGSNFITVGYLVESMVAVHLLQDNVARIGWNQFVGWFPTEEQFPYFVTAIHHKLGHHSHLTNVIFQCGDAITRLVEKIKEKSESGNHQEAQEPEHLGH
jgi:hypothetical protein